MKLFDYAVGNPPYQKDEKRGKSRVTKEIYQEFQKFCTNTAKNTSLIYPATWTKNLNTPYAKELLSNQHLEKIQQYHDSTIIFPHIRTPLTIVQINDQYNGGTFTLNGEKTNKSITYWMSGVKTKILHNTVKNMPKLELLNLNINENNTLDGELNYINEKDFIKLLKENEINAGNYIKMNIKENPGKQADSKDYYTLKKDFEEKYPMVPINEYKVSVRGRLLGRQAMFMEMVFHRGIGNGLQCKVFDPNYTHGATWTILKTFHNGEEAENFKSYMNSSVVAYLAALDHSRKTFGSFIPDLKDWSNSNPIFTPVELLPPTHEYKKLSLNEKICRYFNINNHNMNIILKDNKYY